MRALSRSVVLVVALVVGSASVAAAGADYATPELRAQIQQLQAEVARTPTTAATVAARSQVLWDWVNAYSLNGGYVPVNLTAVVRPGDSRYQRAAGAAALDAYVRELTLLDGDPDALGSLTADPGPFTVRSQASFAQRYTVGSRGIARNGGIAVAKHFMTDHGPYQTSDPTAANFITLRSSNPEVVFTPSTVPIFGMHGGFRGAIPGLFFRLTGGQVAPGDVLTLTYGDRSGGGPGLLMPTMSSDRMPFPLYVDLDGSGQLFSLPIQPVVVQGGEVAGVHAFAPSVVRPGETFELSVRAEDAHYNRATGAVPAWIISSNGAELGRLPGGTGAISILPVTFAEPGVQRITVRSLDGAIHGVANPILVAPSAQRIFWGDTHGHSGFAEGIGTAERFMQWAKEDARLDFVTHSEHDVWLDDYEWRVLQNNVAEFTEPGRFVAYLGYEWSTRNLYGGHHNVLFRTPQNRRRINTQYYPNLSDLYTGLRTHHKPQDVVVIPHAHQSGDYRQSDPQLEPLVEIMSQHGAFEWFGRMYLQHGHQVGFTAASDNHLSQPGYTAPQGGSLSQRGGLGALLADEVSVDALFDAMKALRTYATTGDRMILDVSLNDAQVGQRIKFSEERRLRARIVGTAPIAEVTVVKNGEELWSRDYLTTADATLGEAIFYLSFDSASKPRQPNDNPRGWRPWRGSLEVHNALLVDATPTDFPRGREPNFVRDAAEPNRVRFVTATRGDRSGIRLQLAQTSPETRVVVQLDGGREFGGGPPVYRKHAQLPPATVELVVGELEAGAATRELTLGSYTDTVTLRRGIAEPPLDVEIEVTDRSEIQGDYYYLRVTQTNDASAWTSPIWVGGFPPQ